MSNRLRAVALTLTLATLAACGSGGGSEPSADGGTASGGEVTIARSRFGPTELSVAPGSTVTFENTDPFAHTVTSTDESPQEFDSGELADGDQFELRFDEAGTYAYFCQIHPTMRATVVVG